MLRVITAVYWLAAVGTAEAATQLALPVSKVVQLLESMQKDLEAALKSDTETYERLRCWCETNEKGKKDAVDESQRQTDELRASAEELSASVGSLGAEIANMEKELAESKTALAEATKIREKEAAAFHASNKDLLESVQLLNGAITVLSKHAPAMLQGGQMASEVAALRPTLRHLVHQHLSHLGWLQASGESASLLNFLDADAELLEPDTYGPVSFTQRSTKRTALRRAPPFFKAYSGQSGQVLGVLKQMKEGFEADLTDEEKEELAKQATFASLKGAKESEIQSLTTSLEEKDVARAAAEKKLAAANIEIRDLAESMSADRKFLLELTERCTHGDAEWEQREKVRTEEIEAVTQAIAVLTQDNVKDAQQTTFGFLQIHAHDRRAQATQRLEQLSAKHPEVALLAKMSSSGAGFEKLLKVIKDLIAKLKQQQADEVKSRDTCIEDFHQNDVDTAAKNDEIASLNANIADLTAQQKTINGDLDTLRAEISNLQVELQRASVLRRESNAEFQKTVSDQYTTVNALKTAYDILAKFYNSFLQEPEEKVKPVFNAGDESPQFEPYSQHGKSQNALGLIQRLMGEAQVLVDDSTSDEQNAQAAYETLIADTNAAVGAKTKLVNEKTEELAATDAAKHEATASLSQATQDSEALAATKTALEEQCNFLLHNFAARQEARANEIEALNEVTGILGATEFA